MMRLKEKLYNYEASPPPGTWNKIAAAIEESMIGAEFQGTLHDMEVTPPRSAWKNIAASLEKEPAMVIPAGRKYIPVLRYAAAAAVAGLILLAGLRLFKQSTPGDQNLVVKTGEKVPVKTIDPVTTRDTKENPSIAEESQESLDDAALEESKHTLARLETRPGRNQSHLRIEPVYTSKAAFSDLAPEQTYKELDYSDALNSASHEENLSLTASRYVMMLTPDGQFIRMSKKLGDLVCCVSGEEQDPECIDQINQWRKKVATSTLTPSPGNFMDILNLVKSLQENRD